MYKVKYGLAWSIVDELFKQKKTSYSLRNSDFDACILTFNATTMETFSKRSRTSHMVEARKQIEKLLDYGIIEK